MFFELDEHLEMAYEDLFYAPDDFDDDDDFYPHYLEMVEMDCD